LNNIIDKKKEDVNPPCRIQKLVQTIPLDECDNKTNIYIPDMLKDNKQVLYCPCPHHHSGNGNYPLLTEQ
jgi:hypothetical protein